MSKRKIISSETADQRESDETTKIGESSGTDEQTQDTWNTADESWFPDLKKHWRESDPQTAPLLSTSRITSPSWRTLTATEIATSPLPSGRQTHQPQTGDGTAQSAGSHSQPGNAAKVFRRWFNPAMLAALPFHHLILAEKLASAFAQMPDSLIRPHTVGEVERRRRFFWQSLAAAGVSAKEAALLEDSLHCRFTDSADGKTVEIDWEVHYNDELQGCAEMYRAEMLSFKRRIYEAGEDLRLILEMKADEFLRYLDNVNSDVKCVVDSPANSEARAVVETPDLERWFLDNLTGSFALTVSQMRNGSKNHPDNNKPRKTKSPPSDYTGYRTCEAKRIESWMFSDGEEDEIDPTGEAAVSRIEMKSAGNGDNGDNPVQTEQTDQADETESKKLNEPVSDPKAMPAADPAMNISTAVYRLRLADYWLDWQSAARTANFDFDFLETLTNVRAMRFYELTKLWRLQPLAGAGAMISDSETSDFISDTLEITYDQFASLMPLPDLRYEREVREQLKQIIKPLKASGYVVSFHVKTDWRGLNNASRLVFKFNDDFRADCRVES